MSNSIDPNSPAAGPAGVSGETPQTNSGPVDPNLINVLTLKLAMLKKTPGMSPQVISALEKQLDEFKAGSLSAEDAGQAFDEAISNLVHDSETDAAGVITTILAQNWSEEVHNPLLDKLKKDGEDQNNS